MREARWIQGHELVLTFPDPQEWEQMHSFDHQTSPLYNYLKHRINVLHNRMYYPVLHTQIVLPSITQQVVLPSITQQVVLPSITQQVVLPSIT